MIQVKEKGWFKRLLSEEEGWGEDEPRFLKGLGWVIFIVEDNAGSITLIVSKEKIETFPFGDTLDSVVKNPNTITVFKLGFYGMVPNGEGYFCTNLVNNTYTEKKTFKTFNEGDKLAEEYLSKFIV